MSVARIEAGRMALLGDPSSSRVPIGGFGQDARGIWFGLTPIGLLACFARHEVVEHADFTITVRPSILVSQGYRVSWHGYLERGMWREA